MARPGYFESIPTVSLGEAMRITKTYAENYAAPFSGLGQVLPTSEYQKSMTAQGILFGLGRGLTEQQSFALERARALFGTTAQSMGYEVPPFVGIGGSDFDSFNRALVELSAVWAPVVGGMVMGNQILASDNKDQLAALQTLIGGRAMASTGRPSPVNVNAMAQIQLFANSLPPDQREAMVKAACADLIAKTTDPSMRVAIQRECDKLSKPPLLQQLKWPLIIGGIVVGTVAFAVVVKRRQIAFGPIRATL